jgi:hypothetical protein
MANKPHPDNGGPPANDPPVAGPPAIDPPAIDPPAIDPPVGALMAAVEDRARGRGAAMVSVDTSLRSPVSLPFYENRMTTAGMA